MSTLIGKWGNSLSVRIPSHIAACAHLHVGTAVNVRLLDSGEIIIQAANEQTAQKAAYDSHGAAPVRYDLVEW